MLLGIDPHELSNKPTRYLGQEGELDQQGKVKRFIYVELNDVIESSGLHILIDKDNVARKATKERITAGFNKLGFSVVPSDASEDSIYGWVQLYGNNPSNLPDSPAFYTSSVPGVLTNVRTPGEYQILNLSRVDDETANLSFLSPLLVTSSSGGGEGGGGSVSVASETISGTVTLAREQDVDERETDLSRVPVVGRIITLVRRLISSETRSIPEAEDSHVGRPLVATRSSRPWGAWQRLGTDGYDDLSITEPKLAQAVQDKLNTTSSGTAAGTPPREITATSPGVYALTDAENIIQVEINNGTDRPFGRQIIRSELSSTAKPFLFDSRLPSATDTDNYNVLGGFDASISGNNLTISLSRFVPGLSIDKVFGLVSGTQGQRGPQGTKGDKGDQGDRGATGAQGDRGPQGIQGIQGPAGASFSLTSTQLLGLLQFDVVPGVVIGYSLTGQPTDWLTDWRVWVSGGDSVGDIWMSMSIEGLSTLAAPAPSAPGASLARHKLSATNIYNFTFANPNRQTLLDGRTLRRQGRDIEVDLTFYDAASGGNTIDIITLSVDWLPSSSSGGERPLSLAQQTGLTHVNVIPSIIQYSDKTDLKTKLKQVWTASINDRAEITSAVYLQANLATPSRVISQHARSLLATGTNDITFDIRTLADRVIDPAVNDIADDGETLHVDFFWYAESTGGVPVSRQRYVIPVLDNSSAGFNPKLVFSGNINVSNANAFDPGFDWPDDSQYLLIAMNPFLGSGEEDARIVPNPRFSDALGSTTPVVASAVGDDLSTADNTSIDLGVWTSRTNIGTLSLGRTSTNRANISWTNSSNDPQPLVVMKL